MELLNSVILPMCFKTQRCWVFKPEKNRKQENITRSQWQLEVKIYVTNFKVQENELSGRFLVWLCIHFVERVVQDFPDQSSIALSQTKLESWIKFNNQASYSKKKRLKSNLRFLWCYFTVLYNCCGELAPSFQPNWSSSKTDCHLCTFPALHIFNFLLLSVPC